METGVFPIAALEGTVVHGRHLGTDLGFPTANISLPPDTIVEHGIYASVVELDGERYAAVSNIGTRPTVQGSEANCETHILDGTHALYGRVVRVLLYLRLREERCFCSVEELRRAIDADVRRAREFFSENG